MGGIFFGFEKDWTINKHQFQNWRAKDRLMELWSVDSFMVIQKQGVKAIRGWSWLIQDKKDGHIKIV